VNQFSGTAVDRHRPPPTLRDDIAAHAGHVAAEALLDHLGMRAAMRGARSIKACRSCASSTSRLARVSAVTVAERRARRSTATSPKKCPRAEAHA